MPKNMTLEKKGISRKHPCFKQRQALRKIVRLVEHWVDNGQTHHATTLLNILNTALKGS